MDCCHEVEEEPPSLSPNTKKLKTITATVDTEENEIDEGKIVMGSRRRDDDNVAAIVETELTTQQPSSQPLQPRHDSPQSPSLTNNNKDDCTKSVRNHNNNNGGSFDSNTTNTTVNTSSSTVNTSSSSNDEEVNQLVLQRAIMTNEVAIQLHCNYDKTQKTSTMEEALALYSKALELYQLVDLPFSSSPSSSGQQLNLELCSILILKKMSILKGGQPNVMVETHEEIIQLLLNETEHDEDDDTKNNSVCNVASPKSVVDLFNNLEQETVDDAMINYKIVKLTQVERIRLIATSLNQLAQIYFKEEQEQSTAKEDALSYYQGALDMLCKQNPNTTTTTWIALLDDNQSATTKEQQSYTIDLRYDIGYTLKEMGKLLQYRKLYENAVIVYEEALMIYKNIHGSNDSAFDVMETCHVLGLAYALCNDDDMAIKCFEVVWTTCNQRPILDSPTTTATTLTTKTFNDDNTNKIDAGKVCCDMSQVLWKKEDNKAALQWIEEAIKIYRTQEQQKQKSDDRESIVDESIVAGQGSCSNNDADNDATRNKNSKIYALLISVLKKKAEMIIDKCDKNNQEEERVNKAIVTYREIMDLQTKYLGSNHPEVAFTSCVLGDLYYKIRALVQARTAFVNAFRLFNEFGTGLDDPDLSLTEIRIQEIDKLLLLEKEEVKNKEEAVKKERTKDNEEHIDISKKENQNNNTALNYIKSTTNKEKGSLSDKKKDEDENKYCKEIATIPYSGGDDDGVSQITFIEHDSSRKLGERDIQNSNSNNAIHHHHHHGSSDNDWLFTSCANAVAKIADATGKLFKETDCPVFLKSDSHSIQSGSAVGSSIGGKRQNFDIVTIDEMDGNETAIESTLFGVDLVPSVYGGDSKTQASKGTYDGDNSTLFGVGLLSLKTEESLLGSKIVENEKEGEVDNEVNDNSGGDGGCTNMDDLLAQMNVVTCETEDVEQAKPFKEVLRIKEKYDQGGSSESSFSSKSTNRHCKKRSLEQKIHSRQNKLNKRREKLGKKHPTVMDTMLSLGKLYRRNEQYDKAISIYNDVRSIKTELYGEESNEVAITCITIGDLYRRQVEFDLAMQNYVKARDMQFNIFGKNHPIIASTLNSMGLVELERGDFDVAMDYLQQALRIQQVHLAPNEHNPDVSQTLVNIGKVYYKERNSFKKIRIKEDTYKSFIESGMLGKIAFAHGERGEYIMAMKFYEEQLQLLRNRGETRSLPGITLLLNCLGSLSTKTGRYVVAMDFHTQALNALLRNPDSNAVDVADTNVYIGVVEYYCGRFQKALDIFEEVLPKQRSLLGINHPRVARTLYHVGVVNNILCNYDTALKYFDDALKIQLKALQKNHPDTLNTLSAIGSVHSKLGQFDEALQEFGDVLTGQKMIFGYDHPDIVQTLNSLGLVEARREKASIAMKYFENGYKLGLKSLGDEHPIVATTMFRIGNLNEEAGKHEKALKIYEDCLRIQTECLGEQHYEVAFTLCSLGSLYTSMRKFDLALSNFKTARQIAIQSLGEKHPFIADIHVGRGSVFLRRCHFEEAKNELKVALDICKMSNLSENHFKVQKILNDMARVEHEENLCV